MTSLRGRLTEAQLDLSARVGRRLPSWYLSSARRQLAEIAAAGPLPLDAAESRRFSQNGEDGVVAELVRRVGPGGRRFVEVGASDGAENCTRALAEDGWSGWWVEADPARVAAAEQLGLAGVTVVSTFALRESVVDRLAAAGATGEVDVLVVDIDGDDVGILGALLAPLRPRIVVVEYNAAFPPPVRWSLPVARCTGWDLTFRHGASLQLLADTAAGYRLVHCDRSGVNAFFVREDVAAAAGLAGGKVAAMYRPAAHSRHPMGHVRCRGAVAPQAFLEPADVAAVELRDLRLEDPGPVSPGAPVGFSVELVNGSSRSLASGDPGGVKLLARWADDDVPADTAPRTVLPYPVGPGESLRVLLWLRAPETPGPHTLTVTGLAEQVAWLSDRSGPGGLLEQTVQVGPA